MKSRFSFRRLIILLFVGSMIPLMVMVGFVVYRLQQVYLVNEAQTRLVDFVQAGVEQYATDASLTVLAVSLGENLRVLGADMFIQNANGNPVPPSLGTGPWLDVSEHQSVRDSQISTLQTIGSGAASRVVYLASVVDQTNNVLGSVEASLPLSGITDQLNALRRWLIMIIALASGLMVLLAVILSGFITRPLKSLVESVERVRQGNLETRAPVSEVHELGKLAITYNLMLDRLSDDLRAQAQLTDNMRQFAADASHELRSPLSVFRNSVDVLDKAVQQSDHEQFPNILTIMRHEVDTMASLVENLLLLARLDQPEETVVSILRLEEIHPFPLLEEIYERSQLLVKDQQIELVWPTGEISPILADRDMLRHALNNIVENAISYTPAEKKITLRLENSNGYCCFLIEDQGMGIPSNQLPKIFERFYRSDESRNRKIPGAGLGLAIVAAIVRVHGGEIEVESQVGVGTRFRVFIKQIDSQA